MCGKETISEIAGATTLFIVERNSVLEISSNSLFTLSSNTESHEDCIQNPTLSLHDESCQGSAGVGYSIIADKITFDTD